MVCLFDRLFLTVPSPFISAHGTYFLNKNFKQIWIVPVMQEHVNGQEKNPFW